MTTKTTLKLFVYRQWIPINGNVGKTELVLSERLLEDGEFFRYIGTVDLNLPEISS